MTTKDNSVSLDILCEFFEIAIHNILYIRKLYPEGIFTKRKKYGITVYQAMHPQVNEYIKETLKAVQFHAKANQLKRLYICITGPGDVVYERFVFEVLDLHNKLEDDPIYLELESNLRDFCLTLHSSCSHLKDLPMDTSFRIMLHTTEYSNLSFNDDPTFDDFPWIHIHDEYKKCATSILPLHTIDTNSLTLQMYIEKPDS